MKRSVFVFMMILSAFGFCFAAEPPKAPSRAEIEAVLAKAPKVEAKELKQLNIVLLADVKDHGEEEHDYPLWQKRWELLLAGGGQSGEKQANMYGPAVGDADVSKGAANVTVTTAWHWPSEEQFAKADVIVAFCYLRWNDERISQMRKYLERGGGLVPVHPASWPSEPLPDATELIGIGRYTKFRHGPVDMKIVKPGHPVFLGLPESIHFYDETYWPPTPLADDAVVLATSDELVDEAGNKAPQPVVWTYQCGEGRVFGFQPGHYTWSFDDPYFRIMLLRGTAWAAGESAYRFDELVLRDARVSD